MIWKASLIKNVNTYEKQIGQLEKDSSNNINVNFEAVNITVGLYRGIVLQSSTEARYCIGIAQFSNKKNS